MKQKLLTILTLLVLCVMGAWAGTTAPTGAVHKPGDIAAANLVTVGNNKYEVFFSNNASTSSLLVGSNTSSVTEATSTSKWCNIGSSCGSNNNNISTAFTIDEFVSNVKGNNANKAIRVQATNQSEKNIVMVVSGYDMIAILGKSNDISVYAEIYDSEKDSYGTSSALTVGTTSNTSSHYKRPFALDASKQYRLTIAYGTSGSTNKDLVAFSLRIPAAPTTPTLTGAWKISDGTVTEANVVQGSSPAPTMPTFTVGATSGTPTTDNYTVAYSLKEGSTDGIFTFTDGVPTAISTATAGSATIVATLTTKDNTKYLTPSTNTFEYTVNVSAAHAPTINVTGAGSVVRGGSLTLTADVTEANPDITYIKWYACDSEGTTSGDALGTQLTYAPATTTVGTYYYRAVVNNGVGGDANHDVYSAVQTINVLPKAPTMTAAGMFADSKEVTITKAEGEDESAVIKYSTDNGENWSDYTTTLNFTETTTVKARVTQSGLESAEASATYTKLPVIVDTDLTNGASWDFTSYTDAEKAELKSCTDFWNETKEDKRYGNKVTLSNEHLRGYDGNELSISTGLKYTVSTENKLRFDPGDNRSWMEDGVALIIPGLKAGQIVKADIMTSKDNTARGMNSTNLSNVVGFNSTSTSRNISYGFVTNDGDVTLTCNGGMNVYKIEVLPVSVSATVGANGYTTFACSYPLDLTDANRPEGLKAYKATRTGANLTFEKLNQTVPAGTGLLLLGETKGGTYNIPVAASGTAVASNALIGVTSPVAKQSVENTTYYFVMKKAANADDALKFAPITTAKEVTIPAGKAYIEVPNNELTNARELLISFSDGETTAINGIEEVAPVTKTRKVVKNGRLVIETANGEFTIDGARVK